MKGRAKNCLMMFGSQLKDLTAGDVKPHKVNYTYATAFFIVGVAAKYVDVSTLCFILAGAGVALGTREYFFKPSVDAKPLFADVREPEPLRNIDPVEEDGPKFKAD